MRNRSLSSRWQSADAQEFGAARKMGRRGAKPLEEKIGQDKFKKLLKTITVNEIARFFCSHFVDDRDKERCKACLRRIYRAKNRLEQKEKLESSFAPIDNFEAITEIGNFGAFMEAKRVKYQEHMNRLRRMWNWIKSSGNQKLVEMQRPALWETSHIQHILKKVDEEKGNRYAFKQTLRRLFESMEQPQMLNNPLLTASAKDMRSANGQKRELDRFTPKEFIDQIIPVCSEDEAFAIKMHVTAKSREGDRGKGSILDLKWKDIDFEDTFYGNPMVTMQIYEPKTKGGTWWKHIPVDLWFADLSGELRKRRKMFLETDHVLQFTYDKYKELWRKISEKTGKKFEPHDCRRSPSGWLRDLALSDLAIGQYDPNTGNAIGYTGVGWENTNMFYQRYGKMNPKTIYAENSEKPMFTGLVLKILENRGSSFRSGRTVSLSS